MRLIGQDLHGKENRPYTFSRELNTMYKGKAMNVKIVGEGVNDLPEYDAYYIGEESPLQPVGYLCTQIESEYVIDPTIQSFYSTSNCIDLGRYGPFRKEGTNGIDV